MSLLLIAHQIPVAANVPFATRKWHVIAIFVFNWLIGCNTVFMSSRSGNDAFLTLADFSLIAIKVRLISTALRAMSFD